MEEIKAVPSVWSKESQGVGSRKEAAEAGGWGLLGVCEQGLEGVREGC